MRTISMILFVMTTVFCSAQKAEFVALESTHKFPNTKEGTVLTHEYSFVNNGTEPLIFSGYSVQCTCTKVEVPKQPIAPGQKGVIKVTFDTEGRSFYQDRTIELNVNTKKKVEKIRFKVYVEPK